MNGRAAPVSAATLAFAFVGCLLAYVAGFQLWYGQTALGLVPGADDRELLALARQMAAGSLPPEAFYRAPGYPALLALALHLGLPDGALLGFARLLNSLCHLLTTALCFQISHRLWQRPAAAWLSAALIGFNPVLLHFAGDALDVTLAISLTMLGLRALIPPAGRPPALAQSAFWWGAATLCRPQLLLLCALPPLLALAGKPRRMSRLARASLPALALFALLGALNFKLAGDFRLLPWQGAYNLWSANKPGAHGRFFEQTLTIDSYDETANPARLESEALYRQEMPGSPADYATQSNYWRAKTFRAIAADPAAWLGLMAQKLRYLLAGEEQYNNKTYAFHKARSPWLRVNPIGWTLIFTLSMMALLLHAERAASRTLMLAIALIAAGVLLFYVSDRFRAPLVPVLAVAAGGIVDWRRHLHRWRALVGGGAALAVACFPVGYDPTQTVVQDQLMLASSANALGRYEEASRAIDAASLRAPERPATIALRCVIRFNLWLTAGTADETGWASDCRRAATWSATARLRAAQADWRDGKRAAAVSVWRDLAASTGPLSPDALAGLRQADALDPDSADRFAALLSANNRLLLALEAARGDGSSAQRLKDLAGEEAAAREQAAVERLWGPRPPAHD